MTLPLLSFDLPQLMSSRLLIQAVLGWFQQKNNSLRRTQTTLFPSVIDRQLSNPPDEVSQIIGADQ